MVIKDFINEFIMLFTAIKDGAVYLFYELPAGLLGGAKAKEKAKEVVINQNIADAVASGTYAQNLGANMDKDLKGIMSEKIQSIYDNLPWVKKAREEREANLKPLVLDPTGQDAIRSAEKQVYKYLARTPDGRLVNGTFPAFSRIDVYSYLTDEKMIVYEIETNKTTNFLHAESSVFKTKMSHKDLIFWLTQLSTYIKSGIPLTDGVRVLAQQDKRSKYKTLYKSLIYELTTGQTFSEALARQGGAFPALLVNMIKSAEMTGSIEKTLDEMSDYYQEQEDTKKAVIGAVAYPAVVTVFAVGIVAFMLVYIVPKFVEVYESMNAEINAITQFCLDLSAFLQNNYLYIIGFVLISIFGFIFAYKKIKAFKTAVQRILMHLPVIGKLMIAKEMNLFARTFASLQKNNVLLTDSIDILAKITENEIFRDLMLRTVNNLIKGNKMSDTFTTHWAIPDIAKFMITTGESTGELAQMLDKVADYYQKEERSTVASIKTFIEPVMIIGLAVMVGFILVAILIPMFDIYSTVS